jgi:hypothetical protein
MSSFRISGLYIDSSGLNVLSTFGGAEHITFFKGETASKASSPFSIVEPPLLHPP